MKKLTRHLVTLLKLLLLAGIFYYLIKNDRLDIKSLAVLAKSPFEVLSCLVIIYCFNNTAVVWRWKILLQSFGYHIPLLRIYAVHMISLFFSLVMPGSVSGDGIKGIYVIRENPNQPKTPILASLVVDRVLGLFALMFLAGLGCLLNLAYLPKDVSFTLGGTLLSGNLVMLVFFLIISNKRQEEQDPIFKVLDRLPGRRLSLKVYRAFRIFKDNRRSMLAGLLLSFWGQVWVVVLFWLIGRMFEPSLRPLHLLFVGPLGELSTSIPIAPGGLGVSHVSFDYLYQLFGNFHGAEIFSLAFAIRLVVNLSGALPYLLFKKKNQDALSSWEQSIPTQD